MAHFEGFVNRSLRSTVTISKDQFAKFPLYFVESEDESCSDGTSDTYEGRKMIFIALEQFAIEFNPLTEKYWLTAESPRTQRERRVFSALSLRPAAPLR
jgi:hypothetical protein